MQAGSTCVVFGAGMVGLGAVAGCRRQGAERVICIDMAQERRSWPAVRGPRISGSAVRTSSPRVLEETGGFGADDTFEATGLLGA